VIVLNDGSSDRTGEILQKIKREHPHADRLRIVEGEALAAGWIGKCWACHQLAHEAKGEWLLFTDADTRHEAGALSAAFLLAEERGADLTSLWPLQITETPGERMTVPLVQLILVGYCPLWLIDAIRSPRMVAACGQYMLWKKASYQKAGGHEAVRSHLVEDVALAGRVMIQKMRLLNVDGTDVVSTRMYRSFRDLWLGFTKNFYTGFGGHPVPFFVFLILQATPFLLPWVLLGVSAAQWKAPDDPILAENGFWIFSFLIQHCLLVLTILLGFLVHGIPAMRYRQAGLSAFFYPIAEILLVLIGLNSFLKTISRRGVEWKGRAVSRAANP
jgi:chlorobactene glucosyltransferase